MLFRTLIPLTRKAALQSKRSVATTNHDRFRGAFDSVSNVVNPPVAARPTLVPATYAPAEPEVEIDSEKVMVIPPEADPALALLASCMQHHGNRHRAQRLVSKMLLHLHAKTRCEPLPLFRRAIEMASPSIRMRSTKMGGKLIQRPVALTERQRTRAAIKWLLKEEWFRGANRVEERLAMEIIRILNGNSKVLEQKETLHRLGVQNRSNM